MFFSPGTKHPGALAGCAGDVPDRSVPVPDSPAVPAVCGGTDTSPEAPVALPASLVAVIAQLNDWPASAEVTE